MLRYYVESDGSVITRELYDRLYNEALPDIGSDKLKYGADALRELMWQMLPGNPVRIWEKDGYIVGLESYNEIFFKGDRYFFYRFPLIGADENESKSWWYNQNQFELSAEHMKSEGFVGLFFWYSPGSPVSNSGKKMVIESPLYDKSTMVDQPSDSYYISHPEIGKWGFCCKFTSEEKQ